EHERDRQEGDVRLHEANDRARPAGCRYALDGHEHDARLRQRGEEEPVRVERAPRARRRYEEAADERRGADQREDEEQRPQRAGKRLARGGQHLVARMNARNMNAHGLFWLVVSEGRCAAPGAGAAGAAAGAVAAGVIGAPAWGYTKW